MKTIYLIIYDNDEPYEDRRRYPVLAASTKARANQILGELNDWAREARRNCPDYPNYEDYNKPGWEEVEKKHTRYVKRLKPPYEISELISMATDRYGEGGSLHLQELACV